ncbi:MAG: hypothetical protein K8U57_35900 [Planctomycetes bacterium]|nr:hypothetical protein [Planctomycetota bacterium]
MVKEIICKNGEVALCDDEDFPLLSRFIWYMGSAVDKGKPYPCCFIYGKQNTRKQIFMHQMVMAGAYGVDHIDNDSMNNQKSNFRTATYQENGWNSRKQNSAHGKPCTSKYKGVMYAPLRDTPRWLVTFKYVEPGQHKRDGRMVRVGYFFDEDEAGRAYNREIVKYRGERAWLNPVPEQQRSRDTNHQEELCSSKE